MFALEPILRQIGLIGCVLPKKCSMGEKHSDCSSGDVQLCSKGHHFR